jgi:hypothetical protein
MGYERMKRKETGARPRRAVGPDLSGVRQDARLATGYGPRRRVP